MSSTRSTRIATVALLAVAALPGRGGADFVTYTDESEWMRAATSVATIHFSEVPLYAQVTSQYSELGITFTPGDDWVDFNPGVWPSDGFGLYGGFASGGFVLPIIMEFDAPIASLAIRYPGFAKFDMYLDGVLVGSTPEFFGLDPWSFAGVVSDKPFDKLVISNTFGAANSIDTLWFGAPVPAPAAVGVLSLTGLLGGSRRRRG